MIKRDLILTSDAGFEHRRAAEAIKAALNDAYGDGYVITISNPLQEPSIPDLVKSLEAG